MRQYRWIFGATLLVLAAAPLSAQRVRGGTGRVDPIFVDPVVRDGPPTRERLYRLVPLSAEEGAEYEAKRDSLLTETRVERDSVLAWGPPLPPMRRSVPAYLAEFEERQRVRRRLADAQERLDGWLKTTLGKERWKTYEAWRLEQREAAMAGFRQQMLDRMREAGY